MIYHQRKFGHKQIISFDELADESHFDYLSPCCDLDLEDSNQFSWHNTPTHNNAPLYQVWFERLRRYYPDIVIPIYAPPPPPTFVTGWYKKLKNQGDLWQPDIGGRCPGVPG